MHRGFHPPSVRAQRRALVAAAAAVAFVAAGDRFASATSPWDQIDGTDRAERIVGTGGQDVIRAHGGRDRIVGRGGDDDLLGGSGFDTVRGGGGSDFLHGGVDGAVLVGGTGRDFFEMVRGPHPEALWGGGDEVIRARDGRADWVNCGRGDDVAYVDAIDHVEEGGCERVVTPDARVRGG